MLKSLTLQNFRGYADHHIDFKDISIVVGMNNAGKSTIVDALRILSLTTQKFRTQNFIEAPEWTGRQGILGISPSVQTLNIDFRAIFNHYGDPPGLLQAEFVNGTRLDIFIGPGQIFALIFTPRGTLVANRRLAADTDIPSIAILPQIGPVSEEENLLLRETVNRNIYSSRFSSQFRNQIYFNADCFDSFKELVESTWNRTQIAELVLAEDRRLHLNIRNEDFTGEVSFMGHGLQMWLQTMWFISRFPQQSTLILDEPDVYMHPDLQRKMCRMLFRPDRPYSQVLVTTHSVEIMAEIEPGNLLILDRKLQKSRYADAIASPQALLDSLGSVHNIHLARLNNARRFLVVEGKDAKLLDCMHRRLFDDSGMSLDAIPSIETGGWGGWGNAIGAHESIAENSGGTVSTYVIFDSDYHTPEEISERYSQAAKYKMNLHIWERKEIENYLLNGTTIARLIRKRVTEKRKSEVTDKVVLTKLNELVASIENDTLDQIAADNFRRFKGDVSTANKYARGQIEEIKKSKLGLIGIVSGKKVISLMSGWAKEKFDVSFGALAVAREFYVNEIPDELKAVLSSIEKGTQF